MGKVNDETIRGLFVTGTDTGVGKTVITAAITSMLRAEGMNAGIWKPIQSGALLGTGHTDAERLLKSTGIHEQPEAVAPFSFEAPLTPMLAAKQAGATLTLKELIAAGLPLAKRYEALVIEGAGGVAVPLTDDAIMADLISELGIPALIVARSNLGTINHTLLTASFLQNRGVTIIGVILNDGQLTELKDDPSVATNAQLIEQYSNLKVLGRFPHLYAEATSETLIHNLRSTIQFLPIREAIAVQLMGGCLR
ncbi:dethiobiotin synthetase [Paenibacillus endophyticus]|uniref:ATP-dependent dethiobiotin synthetase BioD n=1 Tax=Paenibacillus endophyticus TaxID=1294268 RepID=A0A7W5CEL9_9BACL|nr:dethiobiotin synthase [Paenibacillus endophyticus]MBB3155850.1 dethiobiotin synthetase [Paenibacillus endophyticus]